MAPEQLRGGAVDGRCDVFALGVVFYEMLTGSPPFDGPTPSDVIAAILMTEPRPIDTTLPGLAGPLVRLIGGCLEKDLERRIGTVAEIVDALVALRRDPDAASGHLRAAGGAIAVLPLENLSGDPAQEYIADGMTEALITDLARTGGLKVISRTSVMGYKGVHRAIREVARELGVQAVVEGTVLCVGGKVRISARLISAEDDELLWAERFDRDLSEVLEVQSEVAQAIAREVHSRLGRGRIRKLPPRRQVDPEVYLLDLQGRHYLTLRTEAGFRSAIQCFDEATRRDPTYAPSFVGLADGHNMLVNFGMIPVKQGVPATKAALGKALELDPDSAEAHRALATIRWIAEFDWPGAEREYRLAIGLDPNSALTRYWYGMFQGIWGRFDDGIVELGRALDLDPLSQIVVAGIGWIHYFARRYDEALRYYDKTLQVDPAFFLGRWWRGEALIELSRFEEGIADLERAVELGGGTSRSLGYLGYAYGRAGRRDEARALLRTLEERGADGYVPPYFPALICCGLREVEQAFEFLHQAVALPDSMARDLKVDPPLDILRPDPRFRDLLGRVGLD
jgi:TolB-like protein